MFSMTEIRKLLAESPKRIPVVDFNAREWANEYFIRSSLEGDPCDGVVFDFREDEGRFMTALFTKQRNHPMADLITDDKVCLEAMVVYRIERNWIRQ